MMNQFETDDAITEVIEKIKSKRLIPFVGAGMSKPLGLPDWDDLVRRVASMTGQNPKEIREKRDLLVAIEYLVIKGHDRINDVLVDILASTDQTVPISRDYENLVALDAPTIYTTNWDNMIEGTYERLSRDYDLVETASDFLSLRPSVTTIIKYHGSLRHPETLVITESDYYERFGVDSPFDIRLRADIMEKSFLFLGYSLRDYNVRCIWNRVQKVLSAFVRRVDIPPSYFVAVHKDEIFETVLRKNNIWTIRLDSPESFPSFMDYLSAKVTNREDTE